ncbi:MAG: cobalamin biosynthesis protein CbiD [Lachnospiraceae bacterium]|nr:cobalamin biosynthesis protein CbiD [Lachnospiraceae bacterium]
MKKGFTTGSCAAAASKAAAYMLLSGIEKKQIRIETPAGETYCPDIEEIQFGQDFVRCAVRKQSGDDPDITNGILVFAKVSVAEAKTSVNKTEVIAGKEVGTVSGTSNAVKRVVITAGEGIGRVTRPGLDQPVGEAAINSVPRQMIESEVVSVMDLFDQEMPLCVEISVPGGDKLAEKTFNPRLGIEGGISIIGTAGIVEPMSTKALLDTILVELRQRKALGAKTIVISPGNYGLAFMQEHYNYDLDRAVKCANYIGDTIDKAKDLGFQKMLLCGHIGKLIKVSGGIMNTHSKEADCRMELMAAAAIRSGATAETAAAILDCVSTEEAIEIYRKEKIDEECFSDITEKVSYYLNHRAGDLMDVQCMIYSSQYGLLGKTERAEQFLSEAKKSD